MTIICEICGRILYSLKTGNHISPVGIGWEEAKKHLTDVHMIVYKWTGEQGDHGKSETEIKV